jgi:hypothetical protein
VAKDVDDRFRRSKDRDRHALDIVGVATVMEKLVSEPHNAKRGMIDLELPVLRPDGRPSGLRAQVRAQPLKQGWPRWFGGVGLPRNMLHTEGPKLARDADPSLSTARRALPA